MARTKQNPRMSSGGKGPKEEIISKESKRGGKVGRVSKENESLACEFCGKVYKVASVLKRHRLSHTRPLQCGSCPRRFGRKDQLEGHLALVHSGEEGRAEEDGLVHEPLGEEQVLKAGLTIVKGKSTHNVRICLFWFTRVSDFIIM